MIRYVLIHIFFVVLLETSAFHDLQVMFMPSWTCYVTEYVVAYYL